MVNGDTIIQYEEKNCERLQTEFLEKKGLCIDDYEGNEAQFDALLESQEYYYFVEADMHG